MFVDIINKKRLGLELTYQELDDFFRGYLEGNVKDYQMSALLMAICIQGMSDEEIYALTKIFIDSGEILNFHDISGVKVDKHSTGGIGDKTTLVIAPIVASLGVVVVKMSGRGLGYTGGTIDKLESIPGFRTDLTDQEIIRQVQKIGVVITGQTADLVPMDKKIYALRDVTATVSSVPLIASSIMSKKIASGADKILIDIKVGAGALLQSREDALKLSELMIKIGKTYHRDVHTIISDMNAPLGYAVGNSLEVEEAIAILKGQEKNNSLVDLCLDLASEMVSMAKEISKEEAYSLVSDSISSGIAYQKFLELVEAQGGNLDALSVSKKTCLIRATKSGILQGIDALEVGELSVSLGAGRRVAGEEIQHGVGIVLEKLVGDTVKKGDILATIYMEDAIHLQNIESIFDIQ